MRINGSFFLFSVPFLALLGCSSGGDSPAAAKPLQLPQFDGLQLIQPQAGDDQQKTLKLHSEGQFEGPLAKRKASLEKIEQLKAELETQKSGQAKMAHDYQLSKINLAQATTELNEKNEGIRRAQNKLGTLGDYNREEFTNPILQNRAPEILKELSIVNKKIAVEEVQLEANRKEFSTYFSFSFADRKATLEGLIRTGTKNLETLVEVKRSLEQRGERQLEAFLSEGKKDLEVKKADVQQALRHRTELESVLSSYPAALKGFADAIKNVEDQIAQENQIIAELMSPAAIQSQKLQSELAQLKLKILTAYRSGQAVRMEDLLQAISVNHLLASKKDVSLEKLQEQLKSLIDNASAIDELKPKYESVLSQAQFKGEELIYNRDAFSLPSPLFDNRVQCYSGTHLFLVLNELRSSAHANTVAIFTSGHVLPGYIAVVNNQFHLYGIETTAAGKAKIDFGPTSQIRGAIRVFDARQVLAVELLKKEITNFDQVYADLLKTVSQYGFNTDKFEPFINNQQASTSDAILNSSPLGVGRSSAPQGDVKRERFEDRQEMQYRPLLPSAGARAMSEQRFDAEGERRFEKEDAAAVEGLKYEYWAKLQNYIAEDKISSKKIYGFGSFFGISENICQESKNQPALNSRLIDKIDERVRIDLVSQESTEERIYKDFIQLSENFSFTFIHEGVPLTVVMNDAYCSSEIKINRYRRPTFHIRCPSPKISGHPEHSVSDVHISIECPRSTVKSDDFDESVKPPNSAESTKGPTG